MTLAPDSDEPIAPQVAADRGQDADLAATRASRHRIRYACVVIDTEAVRATADAPIHDAAPPAAIAPGQACVVMSTFSPDDTPGGDLVIRDARVGDVLRIFAISASNQFDDAVLIADIEAAGGDPVVDRRALVTQGRLTIAPDSATDALPAHIVTRQFTFCTCRIVGEGVGSLRLVFAIYDRDDHGQPRFAGLYQWELALTLSLQDV